MTGRAKPGAACAQRRWVCCADDFALDPGTVSGICALIERGRVTATSVLVDAPQWPAAARDLPAGADVGLHLNFTESFGHGAARVWPLAELVARCRLGAIDRRALRAGIERQLDAFEDARGCAPDYVDGHQHVHQFAGIRDELLAALSKRYGAAAPWLRSTRPPPGLRDLKSRVIAALGDRALRRQAAAAGVRTSAWLAGAYGFGGDSFAYLERLRGWLQAGPDGTVLMCHPAAEQAAGDPIGAARRREYDVLSGDAFGALLAQARIALVRGTALFQ